MSKIDLHSHKAMTFESRDRAFPMLEQQPAHPKSLFEEKP